MRKKQVRSFAMCAQLPIRDIDVCNEKIEILKQ